MCTPACESSYKKAFDVLGSKTTISTNDTYYKLLLTKKNLKCVNAFLNRIASKVE